MTGGVRRRDDEAGQTTVLIVGFTVVLLMLVAVVVNASAAYLRRQALDSLADGAVLAAADALEGSQVYTGGLGRRAEIDPELARVHAAAYLAATGAAARHPGLRWEVRTDRDRVVVTVSAPVDLPLTPPGWARRPVISSTAAAFVAVSD